jgi:hypothetical protein
MAELDFEQDFGIHFEMFWDDYISDYLKSERLKTLNSNVIAIRKFLSLLDYLNVPFNIKDIQFVFQVCLENHSQEWSFSI